MNDPWWLAGGVSPANCVAAYQPIGADSLQASYLNLANPGTYNAAPGVAPTFDASTGWTFNGSTQYLTTGITPKSTNDRSVIARFSNANIYGAIVGVFDTTPSLRLELMPRDDYFGSRFYGNTGYLYTGDNTWTGPGVMAVAGSVGYKDGAPDVTDIPTGTSIYNLMFIGCRNVWESRSLYFGGKIQVFAYYDTTLTAAQVAAITHAMNALTEASLPTHHMPSAGMRRWAKLYSQQGAAFIPAWARNSNRIIIPGIQLP